MTKAETEEPKAETRHNPRRHQPLELEYRAGRINGDLWFTSDRFERIYRRATASAVETIYRPKETSAETLIGPELVADAMLESRYVAFRLGALYSVMVQLAVADRPLSDIASESFSGQSIGNRELTIRGRERAICALRLCETAHDDFDAMKDGKTPRINYALGEFTQSFSRKMTQAANDNARLSGSAIHKFGLRQWRLNEPRVAKLRPAPREKQGVQGT